MPEKIIEVRNLSKRFGSFQAVHDVSFSVFKGDVFGFLGPNGAGKSTSIRCLNSLIKPDSGTVELFGESIATHRESILGRVGSIIEKPDFYKYLSAYRNLEIFSRISGKPSSKREIYMMLDFVGLGGREKDKFAGFSHGMKQRLGIAQTLLHNPDLIILDEPTTGLDPQGIIDIRNLILRLRNEQNKTVLLSSHNLAEIELICNRMVIINKGRSIVEGSVSDLMNGENLILRLEASPLLDAKNLLLAWKPALQWENVGDTAVQFPIEKSEIPALTKLLVDNNIEIFSLEAKRTLEDYFIKIVNQ
ncbi:MAG: ABC transporter ATP-binding protein [Aquirufa sp.]|jgi:ABC-type multidrug transport system ATPase subunit